jgi:hypothetical protein
VAEVVVVNLRELEVQLDPVEVLVAVAEPILL